MSTTTSTSALQAITHQLPWFIRDPTIALIGQECYTTLIYNVDLSSTQCLRLFLSKSLGVAIVVFGSIIKLPQMIKIVKAQSAKGISLTMYALEVWAYTVSLIYAFRRRLPFSTYGENASLTLQNMIITLLIIYYAPSGRAPRPVTGGGAIRTTSASSSRLVPLTLASLSMVGLSLFLLHPSLCSPSLLTLLQGTTIPVSLLSKIPQILQLNRDKATGNLSAIVVFAQLLGTIARVFTTATETDDRLLLAGFAGATVFNGIIAAQYLLYWNGDQNNGSTYRSVSGKRLD